MSDVRRPSSRHLPLLLGFLLIGVSGGCESAGDAPVGQADLPATEAYRWVLEIGRDEGGLTFGGIVPGAFDEDGSLWVGEFFGGRVLQLDADGSLLGRVGRSGEGPGEFGELARVGLTPNGASVWAADGRQGRVTLFHRDSDTIRTAGRVDYYYAPPLTMRGPAAHLADGTFVVLPPATVELPSQFPDTLVSQPAIRVNAEGIVLDTLLAPPPMGIGGLRLSSAAGGGSTVRVLSENPLYWVSPRGDGIGVVDRLHTLGPGVTGRIHVARWEDSRWLVETLDVPGDPIEGDRAEVRRRVDRLELGDRDRAAIVDDIVDKPLGIPPLLSTVSHLHLMSDRSIWVGIQEEFRGDTRWLRYDPDEGEWAVAYLPADNIFRLIDAWDGRVAAVLMDELRVQTIGIFERTMP